MGRTSSRSSSSRSSRSSSSRSYSSRPSSSRPSTISSPSSPATSLPSSSVSSSTKPQLVSPSSSSPTVPTQVVKQGPGIVGNIFSFAAGSVIGNAISHALFHKKDSPDNSSTRGSNDNDSQTFAYQDTFEHQNAKCIEQYNLLRDCLNNNNQNESLCKIYFDEVQACEKN